MVVSGRCMLGWSSVSFERDSPTIVAVVRVSSTATADTNPTQFEGMGGLGKRTRMQRPGDGAGARQPLKRHTQRPVHSLRRGVAKKNRRRGDPCRPSVSAIRVGDPSGALSGGRLSP